MAEIGDVIQVIGVVKQVQHLQGTQFNYLVNLVNGTETWLLSDHAEVIYTAPPSPPAILAATEDTEPVGVDNSWRNVPLDGYASTEVNDTPNIVEGVSVDAITSPAEPEQITEDSTVSPDALAEPEVAVENQ